MGLTQTVAPTQDPVGLDDLKLALHIDDDDENAHTSFLIKVARTKYEREADKQLVTATWQYKLDRFPAAGKILWLPKPPVQSITSITYVDVNGVTQTWSASDYDTDLVSHPSRIVPAWAESWPSTRAVMNAVTVTYVAGYGVASAVPEDDRLGIIMLVGHWREHREAVTEDGKLATVPIGYADLVFNNWHGHIFS